VLRLAQCDPALARTGDSPDDRLQAETEARPLAAACRKGRGVGWVLARQWICLIGSA
jgi:hypothetical protein